MARERANRARRLRRAAATGGKGVARAMTCPPRKGALLPASRPTAGASPLNDKGASMRAFRSIAAYAAVMIALLVGVIALPTGAADHLDAPLVMTDGRQDINDVYAFQSPATATNTVLIMTVNPLAGAQSPTTFNPDTSYDFLIDTTGDAKEDKTLSATFSVPDSAGKQTATLKMGGTTLGSGQTGTTVALSGGGSMRAGVYDDPFF